MICSSCAADLTADARFCSQCGTPVAGPQPTLAARRTQPAEERKVVTVLFCDLAGSTTLSGVLDPELLRTVLLRYYELMGDRVRAHGGVVEKFIGDAVMAVFGLTETREDDARRALVAGLEMTAAMATLDAELQRDHGVRLRARIGLHTGEVVASSDPSQRQALVSGEMVNIAARLQTAAAPGEVLVSAATRAAAGPPLTVADGRWLTLKGVAEPVEAFRLVAVPTPDPQQLRRFDVPFVGRTSELAVLHAAWQQVTQGGTARLLTVMGEPGIGKTRLVAEWLRSRETAAMGRCRPPGDGASLTALAECVAPLVSEAERHPALGPSLALLRQGLLRDGTPAPSLDETGAAVTQLVATVAGAQPLPLVIDDWHWAQPSLLAVLERLLAGIDGLPVLVLCVARPDLSDTHPGWRGETAVVGSLSDEESELLAASFTEVVTHDTALTERIVRRAGGNPLYLEQLTNAIHHDGATADQLPPTLQALVASRIDRLGERERATLRLGALVDPDGSGFDVEDLSALTDGELGAALTVLVRRRLVEPVAGSRYRIMNGITCQVAYGGMTKRRRGELHERYADHLAERRAADALIGRHLAIAHRYQSEVGLAASHTAALRGRASRHLVRAGAEALRRVDLPWALALLEQASELAEPGDPGHAECLQQLGEVQLTLGRHDQARQTLTAAAASGHRVTAAHAELHLAMLRQDPAALEQAAAAGLEVFTAHRDELGLARVQYVLARSCQRRGRHAQALEILEHALTHSLAAGADRELANALGAVGLSLWHGPTPASQAVARCRRLLDAHRDRGAVQATLGFALTMLHAIQAHTDLAASALADAQQAMAALSYAESRFFHPFLGALVAAGRNEGSAPELLREAIDTATAVRAAALARRAQLELARLHLTRGDDQTASELVAGLEVGPDDPADLADLLGLTARLRAGREPDQGETALRTARQAALVARRTDSPADQGRALLDLAHTQASLGRPRPARLAASAAARRFRAKEHLVGQTQALRLIDQLAAEGFGPWV